MNILITHVFGYVNKGDWALLESLIKCLFGFFPDASIKGICRSPECQIKKFPQVKWVQQLGASYKKGIPRKVENMLGLMKAFTGKVKDNEVLQAFAEADLIVACPGGYLNDVNLSIITNLVHLRLGVKAKAPIVLAPQSIGPFKSLLSKCLTGSLLNHVDYICLREEKSFREVLNLPFFSNNKLAVLPDMAFYDNEIDYDNANHVLRKSLNIKGGFIASTLIDWNFPFDKNKKTAREKYVNEMALFAKKIYRQQGLKTLILKQIETEFSDLGDGKIIKDVAALAGESVICCKEDYPPSLMKGIISKSKAFVGSRMHSNIFALQVGIPTVAISYLPKTDGIMKSLGLGDYVVDIKDVSHADVTLKVEKAMSLTSQYNEVADRLRTGAKDGKLEFSRILFQTMKNTQFQKVNK